MKKLSIASFVFAWAATLAALPSWAEPAALKQALAVSGATLDGGKFNASALKDKVVMVYYWSTGCAVCRSHLSELRANLAGWKNKPFALVANTAGAVQYRYEGRIAPESWDSVAELLP